MDRSGGVGSARGGDRAGRVAVIFFCLAIAACEWVFSFRDVSWGVAMALFIAVAMFGYASLAEPSRAAVDGIDALALLPLYILFTSSLPWFFLDRDILLPAVYLIIILLCGWYIYQKGLALSDAGLRTERAPYFLVLGAAVGIPAGLAESFVVEIHPLQPFFSAPCLARDFVYMLFFVALGEELLFRGIIQRELSRLVGPFPGLLLASAMFGVMHMTWHSALEVVYTALVGLVLGYIYQRTGSLAAPVAAHGVGNTLLVGVLPYIK